MAWILVERFSTINTAVPTKNNSPSRGAILGGVIVLAALGAHLR